MSWPIVQLSDVAEHCLGKMLDKKKNKGTPMPYLRNPNVRWFDVDTSDLQLMPFEEHELDRFGLKAGDVVICEGGEAGRAAIWDGRLPDLKFQKAIHRVRPGKQLHNRYFVHRLMADYHAGRLSDYYTGTTIKHFTGQDLRRYRFPLPPLSEQKRIAEILDRAEALRAKRRAALALLDELTQSIFLDMFGDPAVNSKGFPDAELYSLIRENDRLNYGVVQPGDNVTDGGVPLVRVGDLANGKINCSFLKRISQTIESAYKRSRLQGDEILISCVGSIGEIALVEESQKGFNIARAVARVPLATENCREYVAEYLRSDHVQRYFRDELRTVSQPTLNIKQIGETRVLLPPLALQQEFTRRRANVEMLKLKQSYSLSQLDQLFASLQHRAFRGEL